MLFKALLEGNVRRKPAGFCHHTDGGIGRFEELLSLFESGVQKPLQWRETGSPLKSAVKRSETHGRLLCYGVPVRIAREIAP